METSALLKELAKEGEKIEVSEKQGTAVKTECTPNALFEVVDTPYPDIIISRKTSRTTSCLTILFSKGKAFITKESRGKTTSAELSEKEYSSFSSGMPVMKTKNGVFVDVVIPGVKFARNVIETIANKDCLEIINRKYDVGRVSDCGDSWYTLFSGIVETRNTCPELYDEFSNREKVLRLFEHNGNIVKDIVRLYGIENARDFLKAYEKSKANLSTTTGFGYYRNCSRYATDCFGFEKEGFREIGNDRMISKIPNFRLDYGKFKKYVLETSAEMGYANHMDQFFSSWRTHLQNVYRKEHTLDKNDDRLYPENLELVKMQGIQELEFDPDNLYAYWKKKCIERGKLYEGEKGDFLFYACDHKIIPTHGEKKEIDVLGTEELDNKEMLLLGIYDVFLLYSKASGYWKIVTVDPMGETGQKPIHGTGYHMMTLSEEETIAEWVKEKRSGQ